MRKQVICTIPELVPTDYLLLTKGKVTPFLVWRALMCTHPLSKLPVGYHQERLRELSRTCSRCEARRGHRPVASCLTSKPESN